MSAKINSNYLENYINEFTSIICNDFFSDRKYISGGDILQLTPSIQVNYFILKELFLAWQTELEKMKNNPYFDYRDNTVHHALNEFMNVLSRSIKMERRYLEPLLENALVSSVFLAADPMSFYTLEMESCEESEINNFFRENKKYYKWHAELISNIIGRAGIAQNLEAFKAELEINYNNLFDQLENKETLLKPLSLVLPIDFEILFEEEYSANAQEDDDTELHEANNDFLEDQDETTFERIEVIEEIRREVSHPTAPNLYPRGLNADLLWEKYSANNYGRIKGKAKDLFENLGLNHRFMFTKELFEGNPELLRIALKAVESCDNFSQAIKTLNERFVEELAWELNSDALDEFLELIFSKFENKS
jgi:hypothetical protein